MKTNKQTLQQFRLTVSEKIETESAQTSGNIISYTFLQTQFREVSLLLDICGAFQNSSADSERGFSLLNQITATAMNHLEADHVEHYENQASRIFRQKALFKDHIHKQHNSSLAS